MTGIAYMLVTTTDRLGGHAMTTPQDPRSLYRRGLTSAQIGEVGEGGGPSSVPHVITGGTDTAWADAYADAVRRMWTVWEDDSRIEAQVQAPWGSIPGSAAIWGYLNETLVHGWDLATVTGQDPEADPDVATPVLAIAAQIIPAEPRGGQVPFAPVVEPAPGAGLTERLANWDGRRGGPS